MHKSFERKLHQKFKDCKKISSWKGAPTSLVIREGQIKTTISCHYIRLTKMLENLGIDNTKWRPRSGATVLSYIPGGNKQQQKREKPYFRNQFENFWESLQCTPTTGSS